MRLAQAIQRDIDMKLKAWVPGKRMLGNFIDPAGLQAVRRKVDVLNTVVADKQVDDFRQVFPERRFAAAEPEIRKCRRRPGQLNDLVPRQISLMIQFVPIETGLARSVAVRCDKENDRIQFSLAADPPNTRVSLGDTSL